MYVSGMRSITFVLRVLRGHCFVLRTIITGTTTTTNNHMAVILGSGVTAVSLYSINLVSTFM